MTDADVAAEVMRNADFLAFSDGGVTFSGGEPLSQADFVVATVERLRRAEPRLTFAVETSGCVPPADYRKAVSRLDLVLQDVKFPDVGGYAKWASADARFVFENLAWLVRSEIPFVVRVPCIPGVNDAAESKARIAALLAGAASLVRVELLPYNRLAAAKYGKAGMAYAPGFDVSAPSDLDVRPFASCGIPCVALG